MNYDTRVLTPEAQRITFDVARETIAQGLKLSGVAAKAGIVLAGDGGFAHHESSLAIVAREAYWQDEGEDLNPFNSIGGWTYLVGFETPQLPAGIFWHLTPVAYCLDNALPIIAQPEVFTSAEVKLIAQFIGQLVTLKNHVMPSLQKDLKTWIPTG